MNKKNHFDVVIIGGGLSGLALVAGLANLPLNIAVIDSKKFHAVNSSPVIADQELRAIALSHISQKILQGLSVWESLKTHAYPIKHVHVSDRGHFGFTRMHAKHYDVASLGAVIPMQKLLEVLQQKITQCPNIKIFDQTQLLSLHNDEENSCAIVLKDNHEVSLQSKLFVIADGTQSKSRDLLNIKTKITEYQQTAIVANIGVEREHDATAYERFTATGPLALLPISAKAFSIVWTLTPDAAKQEMQNTDLNFLQNLQKAFGYRLGRFSWVSQRQSFPLSLLQSEKIISQRCMLIGNAAHTLHPIAGQGFNLGLRDIAVLLELVKENCQNGVDIGSEDALQQFHLRREKDINTIVKMTDRLVKLFSNNYVPQILLRNLGLLGLDHLPIKNKLAKRAMGFAEYLPDLVFEN